jgi:hypothetical protein
MSDCYYWFVAEWQGEQSQVVSLRESDAAAYEAEYGCKLYLCEVPGE